MKKQIISNTAKKMILFVTAVSFTIFSFIPSIANAQERVVIAPPVFIKYIGNNENQPVFQIDFDNKNEETFNLTIRDEQGTVLYGEKIKDKKFSKKFKYQGENTDNVKLTFTLTNEKDKQSQVYEVNTTSRIVQDVVVTRL